jgi:preprotein translocase subunit SecD
LEGYTWLRLGTIAAMFLGSIYILLPTVLQEDLESRLLAQADGIEAPVTDNGVDLGVSFEIDGDGDALADVLDTRLDAAGILTDTVRMQGELLRVSVTIGADPADVRRVAVLDGKVEVYRAADLVGTLERSADPLPEGVNPRLVAVLESAGVDAATWIQALPSLSGGAVGEDVEALPLTAIWTVGDSVVLRLDGDLPEDLGFALVTVDGTLVAAHHPGTPTAFLADVGAGTDLRALLVSGPLPGTLREHVATQETEEDEEQEVVVAAEPSKVPTWFLGLLPDTKMNLGLDLQGGIDLTLQVGLEEAVLAQSARDITYFKDQAAKEGLVILSVRRDPEAPIVRVETDETLGDVQTFCAQSLRDYVYYETEGNVHAFEMTDMRQKAVQDQAVEQVLETLRKRVDETGVKEPSIVKKGGGRINVQLPGETDVQTAVDALGTTAVLEFYMVDEEFDDAVLDKVIQAAKEAMPEQQFNDDELLNNWLWSTKRIADDRMILWEYKITADVEQRSMPYPLKSRVILKGNDVNDAGVTWDQNQQTFVTLEFKPRGGQIFCDVTGENVGKRFAIVLDRQVQSAPNIKERICGGAARIEMGMAEDPGREAQNLALVLRTGSLDAPVDIGGVSTVGASLGKDSIRSGSIATVFGSGVVLIFMFLWYRVTGALADVALVLNVLMVMAMLALFGATLTLPGIAGIALTVGMAVDANIIIFERIREELRLGVQARKAVDVGFEKGVVAVLDANVTTAIAGVVLFSYGTGPIKGFAVTLLIGIVTTLVTALFVTRTLMDVATRSSTARLRI